MMAARAVNGLAWAAHLRK